MAERKNSEPSLWNQVTTGVGQGVLQGFGGPVMSAEHLRDLATSIYDVGTTGSNLLSGYIHTGEQSILDSVRADEDKVRRESHAQAALSKDVPVLGALAEASADIDTFGAQVKGGVISGATTMGAGLLNSILHPIDTVMGVESMIEHTSSAPGQMLRLAHGAVDAARGEGTWSDAFDRASNPVREQKENDAYWKQVGNGLLAPYKESYEQGRYGEILGRGAFDIGSLFLGTGEAKGAAVAGDVADVARAAEIGDVARTGEVASDVKRMGETRALRNTEALTVEEVERAKAKAVQQGMPEQKIKVRPDESTSYGSMYNGAIEDMVIGNDLKPATPTRLPDSTPATPIVKAGDETTVLSPTVRENSRGEKWTGLTPNQRVTADGAVAHEVTGHRGADRVGESRISKEPGFYDDKPPVVVREPSVKKTIKDGKIVEEQIPGKVANAEDHARALDETQASLRAAKLAPGLTNADRMLLFKDAMQRLAKVGLGIDDVPSLGLFLK